jgi:hypothetical protein
LGIDESHLPEFPEKVYFGSMSPALVRERKEKLEDYFKLLVKERQITREPLVRIFLKLPMTHAEVQSLTDEYSAKVVISVVH